MHYMLILNIEVAVFGVFGFIVTLLVAKRLKGGILETSMKMWAVAFFLMACLLILQLFGLEHSLYAVILMGLAMLIQIFALIKILVNTRT